MQQRLLGGYLPVRSRLMDLLRDKEIEELTSGSKYGHQTHVGPNLSLWPAQLSVRSAVQDVLQICYQGTQDAPEAWAFLVSLNPDQELAEQVALLECRGKTSGRDRLVVSLRTDRGDSDTISLDILIT